MIRLELTEGEAEILSKLLEEASDEFSNHGCNDYPMENTDANWEMYQRSMAIPNGYTIEEWVAKEGNDYPRPPADKKIYGYDWMMYSYFAKLIEMAMDKE